MPSERNESRRVRDHPWIAALFAGLAGLFIYAIWFAPHDTDRGEQSVQTSAPVKPER
jgi:hypothetical protein